TRFDGVGRRSRPERLSNTICVQTSRVSCGPIRFHADRVAQPRRFAARRRIVRTQFFLRFSVSLCFAVASVISVPSATQDAPPPAVSRLTVMQAEDRRAPTARDLAVIRAGAHGGDPGTARVAIRALGRLERPALVADILPFLKHSLPELRSEAANSVAQALIGGKTDPPGTTQLAVAIDALIARSK